MLNKTDVEMYLYKLQKHLINKFNKKTNTNNAFLIKDVRHKRMYAVCEHISSATALVGFDACLYFSNIPDEMTYKDVWRYVQIDEMWGESYEFDSIEDLDKALLINQKAFALDSMYNTIQEKRLRFTGYDDTQRTIYLTKYQEALDIVKNNVTVDELNKYPHINGYAEYKAISLVDAAKQVIFKHENASCVLAEFETMRIKYKDLICMQTTQQGIKETYESFLAEQSI
jgi:hypothetical protein